MAWKTKDGELSSSLLLPINDPIEDYITVLRSNKPCNKTIKIDKEGNWEVSSYQKHYQFQFYKLPITTIEQLLVDMEQLRRCSYYFFVYGAPTPYAVEHGDTDLLKRRSVSREDQPATLIARAASLIVFDIDALILPGLTYDEAGAREVVKVLVKRGLTQLENTKLIYYWTSKAGKIPNQANIRIIGICESAATLETIKAWASTSGIVDAKIYDPQQPIYISDPVITPRAKCPIKQEDRIGMIDGEYEEIAELPKIKFEQQESAQTPDDPKDDVILAKLYEHGYVKSKLNPGKYDITCPWVHEHSNETDSGTIFMLPNYSGFSQHAFRCQHEHCANRDLQAALDINLDVDDAEFITEAKDDDGSADALVRRYIYHKDADRFYDLVTGQVLKIESINRTYAHIHMRPLATTLMFRRPDLIKADNMAYIPGQPRITTWNGLVIINMWKDEVHVTPVKGDPKPWLDHLSYLMDENDSKHFLSWAAYTLQNQGTKINHALLIGGPPRIGKYTLLEPLKRSLGSYNVSEPSAEELKETYTNYLHHTKLVVFQECQNFDKLNIENKLKPMLAAPPSSLRVRMFGQGFYETPNLVQAVFMSNHRNALKISRGDGRYYTIWCDVEKKEEAYYINLYKWLEDEGGLAIVVDYLLNYDVSQFNPKALPPTNAYKELITELGSTDLEMVLKESIEHGQPPFHKDIVKPSDLIKHQGWEGVTTKKLSNAFDSLGCLPRTVRDTNGKRTSHSFWAIRNVRKWRKSKPIRWLEAYRK